MRFIGEAPSNIALIKYMGKLDAAQNKPTNASISYTLSHLVTRVVLEPSEGSDSWAPLQEPGFEPIKLSEKGAQRFLSHFLFLKETLKIPGFYKISSANNFPSDCGLASSASSFAALTEATIQLGRELSVEKTWVESLTDSDKAELSRKGSGSSCRSFFAPLALWTERGVEKVDVPRSRWHHLVVIVEAEKKLVSSSEAHKRVSTSLLFKGRPERAEARLSSLTEALRLQNWNEAFELCWAEFWDMHALFETSQPHFGYMNASSLEVLNTVRRQWTEAADGPLVTMDAGANIHLLYREDQLVRAKNDQAEFLKRYKVISSFEERS